ncbi:LysR family transcriptional regulator [Brevibacterium luteolum]|uniref:LysR family transcriptional regulator n=1 Tax=Brevibacterium luteolum TaxID=199591 RepID=UPI001C24FD33|nr:LysR family transcriptional regulator [Brevibacterium luteolum]MBU8578458.1 LysR family transcriptional regulator [Brevibacterium luteolum]
MVIDTKKLSTLRAVMMHGSFAGAARDLGFTASAVSQQMSALERGLGLVLFERHAKKAVPTEAAHHLHQRANEVRDLLNQIEIDVARLGAGQSGTLRVGTFDSAGGPILGQAMARFLFRRREVEITLDEGEPYELFPRVADGSLDIALGFSYDLVPPRFPKNLRLNNVMTEDLFIVAARKHRLASKAAVEVDELAEETWVAHRPETASHQCLTALCAQHGFTPHIAFRSNNLGTVQGIVAAGLGVAMIPKIALSRESDTVALPLTRPMPQRHIVSATRNTDTAPLATAFLEALRRSATAI